MVKPPCRCAAKIRWVIKCPHFSHHPTIRYMVYNGYYKVMSHSPKMGHLPISEDGQATVAIFLSAPPPPISIPISTFFTLLHGAARPRAGKAPRWSTVDLYLWIFHGRGMDRSWERIHGRFRINIHTLHYIIFHYSIPFHCTTLHYTTYILYIYVYIYIYIIIYIYMYRKQ